MLQTVVVKDTVLSTHMQYAHCRWLCTIPGSWGYRDENACLHVFYMDSAVVTVGGTLFKVHVKCFEEKSNYTDMTKILQYKKVNVAEITGKSEIWEPKKCRETKA